MQVLKYLSVGAASNAIGYGSYVLLTAIGLGSILSMSMVYAIACLLSFALNKNWTFACRSRNRLLLPKYVMAQVLGYVTNLMLLLILSQRLGLPHQIVQLLAIVVVATELFLLSKYYVFRANRPI